MNRKRIIIIGATSAIAEHCARLWAQGQDVDMTLVGRDLSKLERIATDLKVRSPNGEIRCATADFINPQSIQQQVDELLANSPADIVLIAHGSLPEQESCQRDLSHAQEALEINGISPVLFAEAFAAQMERSKRGSLIIIGSVAGDRGRKSNYVYGAAKGLVTRYAEGLQHRFAGSNVKVLLVKPGPTDTPMTAHLKGEGARLAPVEDVASDIVQAVAKGVATLYTPRKWQLIMWVIRHLPAAIFNKLNI
ncbi:SDR family NAD(P)-dependent oxidoreductase [Pseudomonas nitroreducens]|uniref:SDR family NAD(P)-dependent oxidoreductase n=1 Tax=Pseudomonas nitroreducens TaxID=46680 RepID=UPI0026589AFB|nr:SDR family NAD(P)-dependent oxidoreductase [Pseudomonas nitroreducens]MCP1649326.1 short-subunit dehydrogenase [Pseudomonas nitroreducens]MCP1684713.1 short-subunit dehydrogenase [Pseudomonas nitroreducens]